MFHFLRQALGLQTTPSNQTLIGLVLVLTFFIMQPVGKKSIATHCPTGEWEDYRVELWIQGRSRYVISWLTMYERRTSSFSAYRARGASSTVRRHPNAGDHAGLHRLRASRRISIRAGLFLPFLVVDIVVASIINAVGMMQLPPVVSSTPLKLMLFLMVDGWHLLIGALVRSFS